jgi:hypothetical protein
MTQLIDDGFETAKTAIHEAGHLIVAKAIGGTPTSGEVDLEDFSGHARYTLPVNRMGDKRLIVVAGAVAEAKFAGGRWRDYLSDQDRAGLVALAESAGAQHEAFMAQAAQRAKSTIDAKWNDVRRLAKRILQAGGKLEFTK